MNWDNLAIAIEYEAAYAAFCKDHYSRPDREDFYWEHIARPFARSHGCQC